METYPDHVLPQNYTDLFPFSLVSSSNTPLKNILLHSYQEMVITLEILCLL